MKYLKGIFKTALLILCCSVMAEEASAQINTATPYSRFGLGDLESGNSIFGAGLSGSTAALSPFYSINHNNPASYSGIVHPILQVGMTAKNYSFSDGESTQNGYLSKINEISIGLPLNKGFGVAFGLKPFSSVGYEFEDRSVEFADGTAATYMYSGEGGFTNGYLGTSYQKKFVTEVEVKNVSGIVIDTVNYVGSSVTIGVNGNLIFGSVDNNRDVLFDETANTFHRLETNSLSMGDPSLTYGVQYHKNIKTSFQSYKGKSSKIADWNLHLGATLTPANKIQGTSTRVIQTAIYDSNSTDLVPVDTVFSSGDLKGEIVLPAKLTLGGALSISNKKENQFMFSLEWKNQDWTSYRSFLDADGASDRYRNSSMYSVGFQYSAKPLDQRDEKWYKTTLLQLGVRYGDNYLSVNDQTVTEQRVSLGVSIPILGSRTLSRINLGMDFGTVGSTDNDLIKETSLNSYIGISLMPDMRRNGWFRQSKYR